MSGGLGEQLSFWTLVPFALMLGAVALLPVIAGRWFHRTRNKGIVSLVLGLPTVVYLVAAFGHTGAESVGHTAEEYISFILLLLALYTISGGIYLTGNLVATPLTNLASWRAGRCSPTSSAHGRLDASSSGRYSGPTPSASMAAIPWCSLYLRSATSGGC